MSDDNQKISVLIGTLLNVFGSCACQCELNRRDVNPFETDTKGRLFVVDVSMNWPDNRIWQTKVLDSWKATQLNLLRLKYVKVRSPPREREAWGSIPAFTQSSHMTDVKVGI